MTASATHPRPDHAARLAELGPTLRRGLFLIAMRSLANEDDAREAVQETLARTIEALHADRVPDHVPLTHFLYGIARHVIADEIRRRTRHPSITLEADAVVPVARAGALDTIVADEDRSRLANAVRALPAEDRELLRRCYDQGEALVDIAASLGIPDVRLRKRKSRALRRLRAFLGDPGHDSRLVPTEET